MSVLIEYLRFGHGRKTGKRFCVEIFRVHVHCADAGIVIGGVIIDATIRIAAGSVDRDLILPLGDLTTAARLLYRAENMKELAHTRILILARYRMRTHKCRTDEAGCR